MAWDELLFGGLLWIRILLMAAASVLCWVVIARSGPSRAHVKRHAACMIVAALLILAYLREEFRPYHVMSVIGLYWLGTLLPALVRSFRKPRELFNFASYEAAKVMVVASAAYSLLEFLVPLATSGAAFAFAWDSWRATGEKPELSGPQVKPIS